MLLYWTWDNCSSMEMQTYNDHYELANQQELLIFSLVQITLSFIFNSPETKKGLKCWKNVNKRNSHYNPLEKQKRGQIQQKNIWVATGFYLINKKKLAATTHYSIRTIFQQWMVLFLVIITNPLFHCSFLLKFWPGFPFCMFWC